ncbi:MATH domain and coiled-coil domain-containing protein [Cardamine amara subsp. amara]|uniref:MATH domain and coiled-coil domain-containing protein n=1 Tax=Cardamine amara subsp. amara TaxID=228776 RepID=A0ABD0ZS04_CARAN
MLHRSSWLCLVKDCYLKQTITSRTLSDDLFDAGAALAHLREAGFKLDWLEKKLVKQKKKKEKASLARLHEMDEHLQPFKKKCLDLEAEIDKKKRRKSCLAARAPLPLYDDNVVS